MRPTRRKLYAGNYVPGAFGSATTPFLPFYAIYGIYGVSCLLPPIHTIFTIRVYKTRMGMVWGAGKQGTNTQ